MKNNERDNVAEWVFTMNKGDDLIVLTQNQFAFFKEVTDGNESPGLVFFERVLINPKMVVTAVEQPVRFLKDMYPCQKCRSAGKLMPYSIVCDVCSGSGVDLQKYRK